MISRGDYENAVRRTLAMLEEHGIVLSKEERERVEVADFGLGDLAHLGLQLIVYINTQRCCSKDMVLFPWQMCPEHRHPPRAGTPGKEETFRCKAGRVYLYVPGDPTPKPHGQSEPIPEAYRAGLTVCHEVVLEPGDQYTLCPDTLHWFRAGPEGAIVAEFSTPSDDASDVFTDPRVVRTPAVG